MTRMRTRLLAAAILLASSLRAASSPDEDALAQAQSSNVFFPSQACHLGLCLRRGSARCLAEQSAGMAGETSAGTRFDHSFLPGDEVLGQISESGSPLETLLPTAVFVAELIPIHGQTMSLDGLIQQQSRYSTHLHMLDDKVTLKTCVVVLDPGHYQLVHGLARMGGLTGSYFDNTGMQGEPEVVRVDKSIDFDWGLEAVASLSGTDFVASRWCGYLGVEDVPMARKLPNGDKYVLWLDLGAETDGARLWVNRTLLIDAWAHGQKRLPSANVQLRAGTLSSITLEYKHEKGHAAIRLLWSSPWATLQPIPSRNLFHARPVGQPVLLDVVNGRLFNSSLMVGEGVSILTAGVAVQFKMSAIDAYGNAAGFPHGGKIILGLVQDVQSGALHTNSTHSVLTLKAGVEAVSDLTGGFEGLLQITTAGSSYLEAFYGSAGALSATYYITQDSISYGPVQTSLWRGSLTSSVSSQRVTPSLVFREGYAARWAGFIKIPNASDFALYTVVESARERMKLWVDNSLLINEWNSLNSLAPSGTFTPAVVDALYSIMLEYHDGLSSVSTELASPGLSLEWESPVGSGMFTPRTEIPQSSLFSAMALAGQSLHVNAARPDPKTSILQSTTHATAGSAHSFHIFVRDQFGNSAPTIAYTDNSVLLCDSERLEALLDQDSLQIEATLQRELMCSSCALPERYAGSATPLISGLGSLWALLGGFHIQGSPMHLDVNPGSVVASRSYAQGNGLSNSKVGVQTEFKFFAQDEHGNLANPNPPDQFAVKIFRKDSDLGNPRYAGIEYEKANARVDMYPLDMGPLDRVPQQQDASTWKLSFLLTHSGAYWMGVKWAGEHISGSPFSLNVTYGSTCAAVSFVSGQGISLSTAGTFAAFSIFARDAYGNALHDSVSPSGLYFVPILRLQGGGSQRPQHLGIKADDRAVHPIAFTTSKAGQHSLDVVLASAGGLAATYYSNPSLVPTSAKESVAAGQVVDWSSQAGSYLPEWNSDAMQQQYGARWSGLLQVTSISAPTYTFFSSLQTATERVKMWIDTTLLVDQWTSLAVTRFSGSITFPAGMGLYDIKIEYYDAKRFNTTQRGLKLEAEHSGVRSKLTKTELCWVDRVTSPISHRTDSATTTASQTYVYGKGLTLLTAGVSSQLTLIARDVYGNVVDGVVPWIQKSSLSKILYANGNFLSISTTVSGSFSFEVKLLQLGGLQATFYTDTLFSQPAFSGPAMSDLGLLRTSPLEAAVEHKPSYYSIRWTGYIKFPYEGEYTFFADNSVANRLLVNGTQVFDYIPTTTSLAFGFVSIQKSSQLPYGLPIKFEMRHTGGIKKADTGLDIVYSTGGTASKAPITRGWLMFEDPAANSPFTATVLPAPVCASRSVSYGSGLNLVTVGRLAIFFVQSKDEFSNNAQSQYTSCTTSSDCKSGETLGFMSFFRPLTPGTQSRRVISSYNSGGVWDMLVVAITVSGSYRTDVSIAYVGGLDASYYSNFASLDSIAESASIVQHDTVIFANTSNLPYGIKNSEEGVAVRWEGLISIPCRTEESCTESEKEAFKFQSEMTAHDRIKVWLDNRLIIDQWNSLSVTAPTGTIGLDTSDRLWSIITEYKHATNLTGTFSLKWKLNTATSTFVPVPSSKLYRAAPVGGSPYVSRVWPAVTAGNFISFSAITVLTAGVHSYFQVTARDQFNNLRDFGDLFSFKTQQQGLNEPFFTPSIQNGTTSDGVYVSGTSTFLQTQVAEYSSKLYFLQLGGLMATYYDSSTFINPRRAAVVAKVDLCPSTGCGAKPLSSNLDDNTAFSVKFDGAIKLATPSVYTLKVTVKDPSDRIRVWFDNAMVIDQWTSLAGVTAEADVSMMRSNAHFDLTIQYRHVLIGIGYGCRLEWKAPSDATYSLIPSTSLYLRYSSSPFTFRLVPSTTCYAASTATGFGLTLSTVGLRSVFTITSRDEYSNAVDRDSSRFIILVGRDEYGLLSEANESGSFKAVQLSSKTEQNSISIAAVQVGGLTQEYYDNSEFQGAPSISQTTQGAVDFSWSQHVLPWRTGTSSSIRWVGFFRIDPWMGMGLMATYYSNTTLHPRMAVKAVGDSGSGPLDFSQISATGMSITDSYFYSIRWAGFLRPTYSQPYTFYSHLKTHQDRVKLWIDGTILIDQWSSLSSNRTSTAAMPLKEDVFYSVVIEYAHAGPSNTSGLSLLWSAPHFKKAILSESFLLHKNYSTEQLLHTFYVSKMKNAVLRVGGSVLVNTTSNASKDENGRLSGSLLMKTGVLYKIRLEYANAPISGSARLELGTPNKPVPRTVEALQLFSLPSLSDYISGSPLEIFVMPAAPDPSESTLRISSLSEREVLVLVGSPVTFQLSALDSKRNVVPMIQDPVAFLVVLNHAPKSYYSFYATRSVSQVFRHQTTSLTNQPDSTFVGNITTTVAGTHTAQAWLALPGGLGATYYSDFNLAAGKAEESSLWNGPLDWSSASPTGIVSKTAARWRGFLRPDFSGTYNIRTLLQTVEERVKLWVDNLLLIQNWNSLSSRVLDGTIILTAMNYYEVMVEYRRSPQSQMRGLSLQWTAPGSSSMNVPSSSLFSAHRVDPENPPFQPHFSPSKPQV